MENEQIIECEEVKEIRRIRHEISEEFEHDISRLVAYCQKIEEELRQSGKYKFADEPSIQATPLDAASVNADD